MDTWFTPAGAAAKARRLEKRGLPDMRNWRFTTLTIADRTRTPAEAHAIGSDRVRRFFARLRVMVGHEFKWMWKLEIHEDGYPHWHVLWQHTARLPENLLKEITQAWGLGRCDTRRVVDEKMIYMWKYAAKSIETTPDWILHAKKMIRVLQTSRGFFSTPRPVPASPLPAGRERPRREIKSLSERQQIADRKALCVEYCPETGKPFRHFVVFLPKTYVEFLAERHVRTIEDYKDWLLHPDNTLFAQSEKCVARPWLTTRGFMLTDFEAVTYSTAVVPFLPRGEMVIEGLKPCRRAG